MCNLTRGYILQNLLPSVSYGGLHRNFIEFKLLQKNIPAIFIPFSSPELMDHYSPSPPIACGTQQGFATYKARCPPLPVHSSSSIIKFSEPTYLLKGLGYFNWRFLILTINHLFVSIFFKSSSLSTCSVYEILSILLQNRIFPNWIYLFISEHVFLNINHRLFAKYVFKVYHFQRVMFQVTDTSINKEGHTHFTNYNKKKHFE